MPAVIHVNSRPAAEDSPLSCGGLQVGLLGLCYCWKMDCAPLGCPKWWAINICWNASVPFTTVLLFCGDERDWNSGWLSILHFVLRKFCSVTLTQKSSMFISPREALNSKYCILYSATDDGPCLPGTMITLFFLPLTDYSTQTQHIWHNIETFPVVAEKKKV